MESKSKKTPIVWVIGGPGSGKGTLCQKAVEKYGFIHLSAGDLLRNEVKSGSQKGKDIQKIMMEGKLVSNDIMVELLKNAINQNQAAAKGFLIDGFPREKQQGALFEKEVASADLIIYLDVAEETMVKRILGRAASGSGRSDDNEATIKLRIQTFKTTNQEILDLYAERLKTINGEGSPAEVFKDTEKFLDPLVT